MSSTLINNIRWLACTDNPSAPLRGKALGQLSIIEEAYLLIEDKHIVSFGRMDAQPPIGSPSNTIDATGRAVLPTWCDSHTHLVFAASRENEFIDKINGLTYADIAARGGGILNSAARLATTSEDDLFRLAYERLEELAALGTGAIEIKSGYGLTLESELKMLRVIRRLRDKSSVKIKATFLGAHAFPPAFRDDHGGYLRQLIDEMIPAIAKQNLADYIDAFCENGFFSPDEMEAVVKAGITAGLRPKLHVNQLNSIGGLQRAIELNAVSVDHLETMTDDDIRDLAASDTIGTLLPTAAFFLRMPLQPARRLIDAGAAIALASDFNPGSSPSGNMNFVIALSCIQMKMRPEEAINAATINGAFAMGVAGSHGSITEGKTASIILTRQIPSIAYLPYSFGSNQIDRVMLNGNWQ